MEHATAIQMKTKENKGPTKHVYHLRLLYLNVNIGPAQIQPT
jgi:hypothetical protein